MKELGPVDYANPAPPEHYQCVKCKAHGCKLWRDYNTFLDHNELLCARCTGKKAKLSSKVIGDIDEKGRVEWRELHQRSDNIGWSVPAVPTEDGTTYWGYTSVPQPGVDWWYRLPSLPKTEPVANTVTRKDLQSPWAKDTPHLVNLNGIRMRWVGIAWVCEGTAKGDEVVVVGSPNPVTEWRRFRGNLYISKPEDRFRIEKKQAQWSVEDARLGKSLGQFWKLRDAKAFVAEHTKNFV